MDSPKCGIVVNELNELTTTTLKIDFFNYVGLTTKDMENIQKYIEVYCNHMATIQSMEIIYNQVSKVNYNKK